MIYKIVDEKGMDRYGISSGGTWLPGSYGSERAAKYAFRFKDQDLYNLQQKKNATDDSPISFEDLQRLHEETRSKGKA
jgi:hypothetical protein